MKRLVSVVLILPLLLGVPGITATAPSTSATTATAWAARTDVTQQVKQTEVKNQEVPVKEAKNKISLADLIDQANMAMKERNWETAHTLLTQAVKLDAKAADAFDMRGSVHFMLGRFKDSVADFDRYLALKPEQRSGHWRRGISLYYTEQFEEGAKQFQAYETKDTNDVENSVWHMMCLTQKTSLEEARKRLLKIGFDNRIPMMVVYDLFKGTKTPADVLSAAEKANKQPTALFYAHLYLGLYYETIKDPKKSQEHMQLAAEKYRVPGYMWEVARVHYQTRAKNTKNAKNTKK